MANDKLVTLKHLNDILSLFGEDIINKIKDIIPETTEPERDDLPSIFIQGLLPDSKKYVPMEMEYVSKTDNFHSYIYAKLQGNSTLVLPKKNMTISLYKDELRTHNLYKDFKGWGKSNKFVLKADYYDILHARNVVCAKLWSKVVASRHDYNELPEEIRNSPNNGAIDGFPVKVYINGEYHGLYSFTTPKGAWQFGLSKNNPNHALISAEINDNGDTNYQLNPCNFNYPWMDNDKYANAWEIEVGVDRATIRNSWNNIYQALGDNNTMVPEYLDIQSAIDYYIFQDVILGTDGLAKNMLMYTVDMHKWYISAYDMDSTFDLSWEGELLDMSDADMGDYPYLNYYSHLLSYIKSAHWDEMCARYFELRNSVLSEASIIAEFENYINAYGDDIYIQDTIAYPDIPNITTNTLSYLKTFIHDRLNYLDEWEYEVMSNG